MPTKTAEINVPSRIPRSLPSKRRSERSIENSTHDTSKTILTVPNSFFVTSARAFTNPSPELRTTFAIMPREIPNPIKIIPAKTRKRRTI